MRNTAGGLRTGFIIKLLLLAVTLCIFNSTIEAQDRAALLKEIETLRGQLKSREAAFLEPGVEDRAAFAELLRQEGTRLIRLLPREEYEQKNKLTAAALTTPSPD
jgi:hypothetical protein